MRKNLTLYLLLLGVTLSAQNFDPTVRVTGTYQGNVSTEDFPRQEVVLPDSVATFDKRFDYTVFDKPYLGSYDFSPYLMDLRPKKQEIRKNQLYLRAGAGYTLHPLVDAYWNPAVGDSCFNLSVYATHRSYWGTYRATNAFDGSEALKFENGLESDTRAGVKGRYDFKQVVLDWDAFYKGLHAKANMDPYLGQRGYNLANVSVGARSPRQSVGRVFYDLRLDAHYAQDNLPGWDDCSVMRMGYVALYGKVGDMVSPHHGFQMDVDLRACILRSGVNTADVLRNSYGQLFSVTPRYLMTFKKFKMDLGVNVAYVLKDNFTVNYGKRVQQVVYPDVTIAYDPWKQWATFFLKVNGGIKMNTYDDLLESNPYFNARYNYGNDEALLENTIERVNASLGVDGKITSKWSYTVELGYKVVGLAPMEAVKTDLTGIMLPGIAYVNYQSFYAGLRTRYHCEFLDVSGAVRYQGTYNMDHNAFNKGALTLPPFLLDLRATYNYNKRIYAGISLEAQGARKAAWSVGGVEKNYTIRPIWNLGLDAQYVLSPEWSFWLHCDNLLFQEIQRHPFFAQQGGQFTLGFTLNIR